MSDGKCYPTRSIPEALILLNITCMVAKNSFVKYLNVTALFMKVLMVIDWIASNDVGFFPRGIRKIA